MKKKAVDFRRADMFRKSTAFFISWERASHFSRIAGAHKNNACLEAQFFSAENNGDSSRNAGIAGDKNLAADAVRA